MEFDDTHDSWMAWAAYWIPALWVPALLVTHYLTFRLLRQPWTVAAAA